VRRPAEVNLAFLVVFVLTADPGMDAISFSDTPSALASALRVLRPGVPMVRCSIDDTHRSVRPTIRAKSARLSNRSLRFSHNQLAKSLVCGIVLKIPQNRSRHIRMEGDPKFVTLLNQGTAAMGMADGWGCSSAAQ
jgi:hypothetical protein